jgi:hypothetical protein
MQTDILKGYDLKRVNSDINGNPRYVIHFLAIAENYARAVKLANTIGGRKYTAKWYGGGIVFQSYSTDELAQSIAKISETINKE